MFVREISKEKKKERVLNYESMRKEGKGKRVSFLRVISLSRCEGSAVSQGHRVERRPTGEHTFAVDQVRDKVYD